MLIKSTKKEAPTDLKIGIFAKSGAGKTSAIKTLPCQPSEILILDIENGLEVLRGDDYACIDWRDIEGDPLERMRTAIGEIRKSEFEWIAIDSLTKFCSILLADMQRNGDKYGLITAKGAFDGLRCYGELKKYMKSILDAILNLKMNKLVIFGGQETKDDQFEVMLDGSLSASVMFEFDEFYAMRVTKEGRQFVTNSDGYYVAKSRMSGGAGGVLETYEPADLAHILAKCYQK